MDPEMEKMMKEYAAMDSVATEILSDKQQVGIKECPLRYHQSVTAPFNILQIVDLDAKRNKGREALRNLKKTKGVFWMILTMTLNIHTWVDEWEMQLHVEV